LVVVIGVMARRALDFATPVTSLVLAVFLAFASRSAAAAPIVDRNYAIELYEGVAIGDTCQVGMGGAGAAVIIGSAGALLDAAAPVIKSTTDNDSWSWDYHFDFLTGRFSTDYDNNGTVSSKGGGAQLFTGGLAFRYRTWAAALTVTSQSAPVEDANPALDAQNLRAKFAVSHFIRDWDLAVGVGVQTATFQLLTPFNQELFAITGGGGLIGGTWLPSGENFRASAAFESAIIGAEVRTSTCDPNACQGYILPNHVESPARTILGGAYRFGPTAWNTQVDTRFRDEQALTIAADLVVTGTSPNANGVEAFGMQELQPSGRRVSISVRGGAEFEWLPGRLRVRGGSYWEPGRFDNISGRLHGTFGIDLRALEFELWGMRRGRLSATGDIAARYRNIALSIGFWH
jgi:hypothetical protein